MNNMTAQESRELLEKMGVSIEAQSLVFNAQEGKLTEVKHLVNAGIDVNSKSREGYNALMQATLRNHTEIIKFLIDSGANINVTDENRSLLFIATLNDNREIVKLFIDKGLKLNPDDGTLPPILAAALKNNRGLLKELVAQGAEINTSFDLKDNKGVQTLVHYSFHNIGEDMYQFLVSLGAYELSEGEKKKESGITSLFEDLKQSYTKKSPFFLGFNVITLILIFAFFNNTIGALVVLLIFAIIGALIGRTSNDRIKGMKQGIVTMLIIGFVIAWSTDEYESNKNSYKSTSSSSGTHTCTQCGSSYSHNGWSTAGGEQFQHSSDPGYNACCSKSCAYESQPARWKR